MKKDIQQFLESTLLEEYVMGTLAPEKVEEVEGYIQNSEEVRKVYDDLQNNMELLAKKMAVAPPPGMKIKILDQIDEITTPQATSPAKSNRLNWGAIAASAAALIFAFWTYSLSSKNDALNKKTVELNNKYELLEKQCADEKLIYAQQEQRLLYFTDEKTQQVVLTGNSKSKQLETLAYWNKSVRKSYIKNVNLPKLPNNKCYQLWADVDGEMISLNVISQTLNQFLEIPFKENATSLNITIEPAGGSDHPTVSDLVASVSI